MKIFSANQVHEGLPYRTLIQKLVLAHEMDVEARESVVLEERAQGYLNNFLALPAWQYGRAMGAKLVNVFPANETNGSGLPSIQGVYVLFSGKDGRPLAVIDGTALTLRKTAADSAAGARFLAREDAECLLMVGAGALGPHLIEAHCAARRSIRRVLIWNRTPTRAERLADGTMLNGVEISATKDLDAAARQADVISCATMATEPLIRGEWLKPGTHLDLVGSFRPDMHECDEDAMRRASVFVDSPWSAVEDSGEIVSAMSSGALVADDILADLFALARGNHVGRTDPDQITVFKNGGGGHLDLMVAQILCPVGDP